MQKIKFYPLDAIYKIIEGKPIIHLFGKTLEGKQICVLYDQFLPYFYVIPKEGVNIKQALIDFKVQTNSSVKITKVEEVHKMFVGKEVMAYKVYTDIPPNVPILREELKKLEGIESMNENDILFFRRFLIDHKITPLLLYEAEGEYEGRHLKVPAFMAQSFQRVPDAPLFKPKMLSIDIETYTPTKKEIDAKRNPILMMAIYAPDFQKVFTWKNYDSKQDFVHIAKDEKEMLQQCIKAIAEYSPDILCGYYSDGFDLPYIKTRAEKFQVKVDLGLDYSEMSLGRGQTEQVEITGMTHIDIFKFIKKVMGASLKTDSFSLNAIAEEILGEKKIQVDLNELSSIWDDATPNLINFIDYNIHDAKLSYLLVEKMLPNISEMVKITGLTMFDVTRMGYSQLVEWYLLKQAPDYNQIAPNKPREAELLKRKASHIQGAFVFEPKAGLYNDIVIFDYLSLYPTIIGSHNLSGETVRFGQITEDDAKTVPLDGNPFWISQRKRGFLPEMIEGIIRRRMEIKKEIEHAQGERVIILDARQYSLKLLANAFYGYLGFYAARWYSREAAEATTAFGRYYIKKVIGTAQEKGFSVIYSDTDSVFLTLGSKTKQDAMDFAQEVNKDLPGLMELEFDGFYPRGLFVSAKASGIGAKKRYALLSEENSITIKGFESVRRNTSPIAREVQENVFSIILREQDTKKALKYVKDTVMNIRKKLIPNGQMVIHIQLTKEIDEYDSKGPHVAVAQRLRNQGIHVGPGSSIGFIVCQGADNIRDRAKFPEEVKQGEYDAEYYVHNQVIPAVERVFNVLGFEKDHLLESHQQTKLAGFFS